MAGGEKSPQQRERLRPRLYGVAVYLVAGILLLQLVFCLSVFVLRPYAKAKTPDGILNQERVRATDAVMDSIFRNLGQNKATGVQPRAETNPPAGL